MLKLDLPNYRNIVCIFLILENWFNPCLFYYENKKYYNLENKKRK